MPRTATVRRSTSETKIDLSLGLDGSGKAKIATGVGFFDHMLTHVAKHGLFDLTVKAERQVDLRFRSAAADGGGAGHGRGDPFMTGLARLADRGSCGIRKLRRFA